MVGVRVGATDAAREGTVHGYNGYAAPRRPSYLDEGASPSRLFEMARRALGRTAGRGALGRARPGERVLLVVPPVPVQQERAAEAIVAAFEAQGFSATLVHEDEIGMAPPGGSLQPVSAADGWKEITWRPEVAAMLPEEQARQRPQLLGSGGSGEIAPLKRYLDEHPEFTAVFAGAGGRRYWIRALEEHGPKFRDNWVYTSAEDVLSLASVLPSPVWELIERKALEWIPRAAEVRVSDPQGTDIGFAVSAEDARVWFDGAAVPGHLYLYPLGIRQPEDVDLSVPGAERLIFPPTSGTIAGTANHVGFYPHLVAHVEDGVVTRLEGGGLFGDLLRLVLDRTREVAYPRHPRPGYFYLTEIALGTNPKETRGQSGLFDGYSGMPNVGERKRSGVLHWGFGVQTWDPGIVAFARARGLPWEHGWHIHSYFATYRVRLRDSGEWRTVIDRGRLTALDDPEVQAAAARHDDGVDWLQEDWIPALPGINVPGAYLEEYGRDPVAWIRAELAGHVPVRVP